MSVRCLKLNILHHRGCFCTVCTIWGSSLNAGSKANYPNTLELLFWKSPLFYSVLFQLLIESIYKLFFVFHLDLLIGFFLILLGGFGVILICHCDTPLLFQQVNWFVSLILRLTKPTKLSLNTSSLFCEYVI